MKVLHKYLQENLGEKRYLHSLGVAETAVKLSDLYGADGEKAEIAGLIHDCAKYMSGKKLLDRAFHYNINIDNIFKKSPTLLHGPVGAFMSKEEFGIEDDEIFDSIYYHTTGKADMTALTKVIYLSDYIEPHRNFPGVEELRELSYTNLDKALVMAFDNTILHVIAKAELIHFNTIDARNYLIENMG